MGKDTLENILSGLSDKNIRFEDLKKVITNFGFGCRIKGDHHIFAQVRNLILKYKLHKGAKNV